MPKIGRRITALLLLLGLALASCSRPPPRQQLFAGGEPITGGKLTAARVRQKTKVTVRGAKQIFRAPTLRVKEWVNFGAGGLTMGPNMGTIELARSGYLFGERDAPGGEVKHYLVFQWDLCRG